MYFEKRRVFEGREGEEKMRGGIDGKEVGDVLEDGQLF